jgi:phosphate transport system permease protein
MTTAVTEAPSDDFLRASGRALRRKRLNFVLELSAQLAAMVALGVLGVVVFYVTVKGAQALNLDFFTKTEAVFGQKGGGIAHAIVGTVVIVFLAAAMTLPVGVLVAIYLHEFGSRRVASVVRMALDMLTGIPTIVIGIFVFVLLVKAHGQSAFAAAIALSLIMLPLVVRSTEEVLVLVPKSIRDASLALGASRSRTVIRVVIPAAIGGILTGAILGIARGAGETAPILFTSSLAANFITADPRQPLATIPVAIFTYSESANPADHAKAWAAALVLLVVVLVTSVLGRLVSRKRRQMLERTR